MDTKKKTTRAKKDPKAIKAQRKPRARKAKPVVQEAKAEEPSKKLEPGNTFNLFVYGTLQSSYDVAPFLKALKHEKATATGIMFNLANRYPGVKFDKGSTEIVGEIVYDVPEVLSDGHDFVDTLEHLDRYERATGRDDAMYARKVVKVTTAEGKEVEAFAYEVTDYTMSCMPHNEIAGDWLGFLTRSCPHFVPGVNGKSYQRCSLTGRSCPYSGAAYEQPDKFGICTLPSYADQHPEKNVPDIVLKPIAGLFGGCLSGQCDALTHHYYRHDCADCGGLKNQLQLMYLAKCYNDRKAGENK